MKNKFKTQKIYPDEYNELNQDLTFEYGGYHFTPYMILTGKANEWITKAHSFNYKSYIFPDDKFSHSDFYAASPIKECDLFKCVENGCIYIPVYNLFEYTGEFIGIDPIFKVH